MKIIVTGSLGRIGKPLTEKLVQRGHLVVVISSNPGKEKDIVAMGATAAIGSLQDIDFLVSVFTGADVVHAMIPPNNTVPDPLANSIKFGDCLAQAVGKSGVKRVVYVSSYGAQLSKGTGLIAGTHHTEIAFDKLELDALTFLRATYIYYNLYSYLGMIKSAGFIGANYGGDDLVVMVSPEDIATAAVEAIESTTNGRKVTYVSSDERTCNEIAKILGEAIGKPDLKWLTITDEQMQDGMVANGLSSSFAAVLVEMFGAIHSGLLHEDYDLHKPETTGKVKIEDFAKEFAAVFNQN